MKEEPADNMKNDDAACSRFCHNCPKAVCDIQLDPQRHLKYPHQQQIRQSRVKTMLSSHIRHSSDWWAKLDKHIREEHPWSIHLRLQHSMAEVVIGDVLPWCQPCNSWCYQHSDYWHLIEDSTHEAIICHTSWLTLVLTVTGIIANVLDRVIQGCTHLKTVPYKLPVCGKW